MPAPTDAPAIPIIVMPPRHSAAYRPEIDGLRALAVLGVMLFHAKLAGVTGGFVGVDVFFVVSGYLITGLILREGAAGFSFREFYLRRARRILPSLGLMLVIVAAIVPFVPPLANSISFWGSLSASALSLANLWFWWTGAGYFAPSTAEAPLSHLWSLAIEEQYYILFPPLLVGVLHRWGRRGAIAVSGTLAAGSFLLSLSLNDTHSAAAYYLLPSRAWGLLAGALLAFAIDDDCRRVHARLATAGAAAGLLMILGSAFLLDDTRPYPGVLALPTVAGTMLVLAYAHSGMIVGRVLAWPPFRALGLVSYGAFLWHQPLLALRHTAFFDAPSATGRALVLLSAVMIAALAWHLVEQPLRRPRPSRDRRFAAGITALFVALTAVGLSIRSFGGLSIGLTPREVALMRIASEGPERSSGCFIGSDRSAAQACVVGARGVRPSVALIGDSHAAALAPAFDREGRIRHRATVLLARSTCPPLLRYTPPRPDGDECRLARQAMFDRIARDPDVRTVVLAARWISYFERVDTDNGEGGVEAPGRLPRTTAEERLELTRTLRRTVAWMRANGKAVIIVEPIPEIGWHVPHRLVLAARAGIDDPRKLTIDGSRFAQHAVRTRQAIAAAARQSARLDPSIHLCTVDGGRRCIFAWKGRPLYFDDDHLSPDGALVALPPDTITAAIIRSASLTRGTTR